MGKSCWMASLANYFFGGTKQQAEDPSVFAGYTGSSYVYAINTCSSCIKGVLSNFTLLLQSIFESLMVMQ